ncbi:zinc finger protein 628 [Esox lucius]|uniref:C2H2-type domain-containing protein n=1 Tax=Esox lucius TaxID=8010 RepID=A0A6Q2XYM4_ESOLU|nr:zinc finger protein 628 [Esox lucius]
MLGLQGSTSSPKMYRCVACSSTFTGLASLLVHQASHAVQYDKQPPVTEAQPPCSHCGEVFSNKELLDQHCCKAQPETQASSLFICDCGDEFQDFNEMLEHKRSHVSTPQQHTQEIDVRDSNHGECSLGDLAQPVSCQPNLHQSILGLSPPSNSTPLTPAIPCSLLTKVNSTLPVPKIDKKEGFITLTRPPEPNNMPPEPIEQDLQPAFLDQPEKNVAAPEPPTKSIQDESTEDTDCPVTSSATSEAAGAPKNKTIMKMVANAYMKRFQPSQQYPLRHKRLVIPKREVIPVEVTAESKQTGASTPGHSVGQLRHLLSKSGAKSIARPSSSSGIISLTQTFCPVVVLETRQKLCDSSNSETQGRYQCGRCRRVFQDLNSLTVHHALHRKEIVKCCRHCKQLMIGKPPLPDNHICPLAPQHLTSVGSKFSSIKKTASFYSQKDRTFKQQQRSFLSAKARTPYFCQVCKHSYARSYNLKVHKCQGPPRHTLHATNSNLYKTTTFGANLKGQYPVTSINEGPLISKSIAVGPDITRQIKEEVIAAESTPHPQFPDLLWSGSPKSFSPFYSKVSKQVTPKEIESASAEDGLGDGDNTAGSSKQGERDEGEWTMPLDDSEIDVLIEAVDAEDDDDLVLQEPISQGHVKSTKDGVPYFIKDGVRRFPCYRCQKTYSRGSTLRKHQRLCGNRAFFPQSAIQAAAQKVNKGQPQFDCYVCGLSFNRKDNLLVHRKKCQLSKTVARNDHGHLQQRISVAQAPPRLGAQSSAPKSKTQEDNGQNWGIMSLPNVLPRRVTCECGAGFTSPRLLLEHLQKHAQESYTCPTCGETLSSWADYEVHLQVHMQPRHKMYGEMQLQRSPPLLLRFPQQPPQHRQPMPKQRPVPQQHTSPVQRTQANQQPLRKPRKQQPRSVCIRCSNTFCSRGALLKHLSLNRCKGDRGASSAKANHCSRCSMDFPNALSLKFHQLNGMCKPAFKPMRCPVCVRWFGTVEGLQKHLQTHDQPKANSFRCVICQRHYPSLRSLKDHRRKVHRILSGDTAPVTR